MSNLVFDPDHYNHDGRKECWEEMFDVFSADAVIIFDCLNAYKYLYRAGTKLGNSSQQDISKAMNYYNHAKKLGSDNAVGSIAISCINKIERFLKEVK